MTLLRPTLLTSTLAVLLSFVAMLGAVKASLMLERESPFWSASTNAWIYARGQAAIFVGFHAGNNELGAAALGERQYDVNVVADDSAFPEMYELLRRLRAAWGIKVILHIH